MSPLLAGFTLFVAAAAGDVYVADGGRLVVSGTPIDLAGVDAPHPGTDAGQRARAAIRELTDGKTVICHVAARSGAHGPRSGVCFVGGEDIGATLIARGLALDCPRVSEGRYRPLEPEGSRTRLQQRGACLAAAH